MQIEAYCTNICLYSIMLPCINTRPNQFILIRKTIFFLKLFMTISRSNQWSQSKMCWTNQISTTLAASSIKADLTSYVIWCRHYQKLNIHYNISRQTWSKSLKHDEWNKTVKLVLKLHYIIVTEDTLSGIQWGNHMQNCTSQTWDYIRYNFYGGSVLILSRSLEAAL